MYCRGALNLIDSFVSGSAPPCAFEFVVIETSVNPPTELDKVNEVVPFDSVLLVTIYSNITILPSDNFLPITSSPK